MMTDDMNAVRDYLAPPPGTYWKWADNREAIVTVRNEGIVLRQELATVLRSQLSWGLPPLGSVVLLLAACCDAWEYFREQIDTTKLLCAHVSVQLHPQQDSTNANEPWFDETMHRLDAVHSLPMVERKPLPFKEDLIAAVFECATLRTTPEEASEIVQALSHGLSKEALGNGWRPEKTARIVVHRLLFDLNALHRGLMKWHSKSLRTS